MKLFVYGTLMSGFWNNRLLEAATPLGVGRIPGTMFSLGGFPGIHLHDEWKDNPVVYGELYEIDESILARCDRLEGYRGPNDPHNFYVRKSVNVAHPKKEREETQAFVYEWNGMRQNHTIVHSGDWREYVNGNQNN